MRFDGLDLNLLVALNALLDEQSVSIAAERMNLSQGAMSAALNRLREFFRDDLLVSVGRKMVMTPRAQQLALPVRNALLQIRSTITTKQAFDPADSDRHIAIIASDYFLRVVLCDALREISAQAPGMTFDIGDLEDDPTERLQRGEVDLMVTIEEFLAADHPSRLLFEETHVVTGWKGNPHLKKPIDKETFLRLGHVTVSHGVTRVATFSEMTMRTKRVSRRIEIVAPGFSEVPHLLVGTNRIAVMHRRLAEMMQKTMPLVIWPVPFEFPKVRLMAQWNAVLSADPALNWVIERLSEAAQQS